ncbi:TPA: C40 family peptidase [Clostridium perfringens]|uniref:C40 family peptidase n=2 Tax=Clostridium perfringens TaxID=1502 RepID=A0A8H9R0D9_CLOPF|nr:C40 family peptidase [Clostridium perfringens]EDT15775.1 probable cell wall-binding protein [Clostridium perfringens E str. JGS1987]MCX0408545.1 C40 family peptidase [Clostridium perfringens]HAT4309487.1 C40 family peptidase [Clostridium perfringens]
MLKDFLKNTARGILSGNGTKESAKEGAKKTAKNMAVKGAKNVAKKGLKKALTVIMIPWGCVIIAFIILVACLAAFFTGDDAQNKHFISEKQEQMILTYAQEHIIPDSETDFYGFARETLPTPQIIDNYIKFLALNENVEMPLSDSEVIRLADKAIKGLKPKLTFEDSTITTVTTTKPKEETPSSPSDSSNEEHQGEPKITTTTTNIKLLKSSDSVYGHVDYIYKMETTEEKIDDYTTSKITKPVLSERKQSSDEKFTMLREVLKSEGVKNSDLDMAIGFIIFSQKGNLNSCDWIFKDKFPAAPLPLDAGGFGGGYYGGDVAGLPKGKEYLQPFYTEASKLTGVPNWFLIADTECESSFDKNSVSNGGGFEAAYGLLQFWYPNWHGNLNEGLRTFLNQAGYTGSDDALWQKYLQDERMQILVGAWEWRYYVNYYLWFSKRISSADFNNTANVSLINWDAPENDPKAMHDIKTVAAVYNCGQAILYNNSVNTDTFSYSCKVYNLAMKYRGSIRNQIGSGVNLDGTNLPANQKAIIQKAINAGLACVGNGRYVFGGGRNMADQAAHIFDCSSFVWYCYNQAGVKLGDLSSVNTWSLIDPSISTRVSMSQIQPGDFILFNTMGQPNTHIGIYMGDGKFVNAQSSKTGIKVAELNSNYWRNKIDGVYRPHLPY